VAPADQTPPAFEPDVEWVDPLVWVRELHKEERGHRLGEVCARLGIALDNAHRAASDAAAAGRVLLALAPRLPVTYGELIRLQTQYAARQDVDMAMNFRRR
jgi:DNA polymerase III subunit epsilon